VDVEARNDTSGQHAGVRVPGPGRRRNQMPVVACNWEQRFERIPGLPPEQPSFRVPRRCGLAGISVNRRKVRADLRPLLPMEEGATGGRGWRSGDYGSIPFVDKKLYVGRGESWIQDSGLRE
jgi:hypothetical protein